MPWHGTRSPGFGSDIRTQDILPNLVHFQSRGYYHYLIHNGGAGEVHELRVGQGRGLHGGGHDGGAGGEVHELRVGANSFKVLAGQSLWPSRHVNLNFAIPFLALPFEITPKKLRDQA